LKNLKTKKGLRIDMGLAVHIMEGIYKRATALYESKEGGLEVDLVALQADIMDKTRVTDQTETGGVIVELRNIKLKTDDGVPQLTPEEKVLTSLYDMIRNTTNFSGSFPLGSSQMKDKLTHAYTRDILLDSLIENANEYSSNAIKAAVVFTQEFNDQWRKEITLPAPVQVENDGQKQEENRANKNVAHDESLFLFIENQILVLEGLVSKHGEGVREIFTYLMMTGLNDMRNIDMMSPLKLNSRKFAGKEAKYLLSGKIYKKYAETWEETYYNRVDGVLEMSKEVEKYGKRKNPTLQTLLAWREREDC
jgi:hypothetical protein